MICTSPVPDPVGEKNMGRVSILGYTNKLHGRALEEKSHSNSVHGEFIACASFEFIIASKQY